MRSQAGGLARRVGLDRALGEASPRIARVWVDAGNFAATELTPAGKARTDAILKSFAALPTRAVNVADREMDAGLDVVGQQASAAGVALTSASLVRADGSSAFPAALVADIGGRCVLGVTFGTTRVGFVGVMRHLPGKESRLGNGTVRTRPVDDALAAGVAEARRLGADIVVVLAALPVDELRSAVDRRPEVDVAVASFGKARDVARGQAVLAHVGDRGQDVVEARVGERGIAGRQAALRYHHLDPRYPSDPEMVALQRETSRRVNDWNREAAVEAARAFVPRSAPTYAGGAACRPCHVSEHLTWEATPHRQALHSLVEGHAEFNAECLRCHVTGLGTGGFRSAIETPEMGGVQCEACHGPGVAHVASGGKAPLQPTLACVTCHDADNSPTFDLDAFWARIRHGGAGASPSRSVPGATVPGPVASPRGPPRLPGR